MEDKTSCWLQAVPASVRTRNSDASLRKEWVADNVSALLKDLLQPQQPVTPIQRMGDFIFPCHTFETRRAPLTPEKVQQALTSCPVNDDVPLAKRQCVVRADDGHGHPNGSKYTLLNEFGSLGIPKLKHNCIGKVLMTGCVALIPYGPTKSQSLPKLTYIMGSSAGTVEVVVLGAAAHKVAETLAGLQGKVIKLHGVVWDSKCSTLKHGPATFLQMTSENDEQFAHVGFKLSHFHMIGAAKLWSRLSVQGCIHSLEMPQPSERKLGQTYCDCFLQNQAGQAVKVRMVTCNAPLRLLQERQVIIVQNGKVNSTSETLHADMDDLCEVQVLDVAGSEYPAELTGMITWQH